MWETCVGFMFFKLLLFGTLTFHRTVFCVAEGISVPWVFSAFLLHIVYLKKSALVLLILFINIKRNFIQSDLIIGT